MSKILIKNANLISMCEHKEIIEKNIDILIDESKISMISKKISENVDKVIDASDKYVMPGLINTHSHVPMSIFRETVEGLKTQEWLTKKIWPMEEKLTKNDIYYSSLLSFIEMIYSGTTTVNDMYFLEEGIIDAAIKTKIRIQLTRTLMDADGNGEKRYSELKESLEKYYNKYDNILFNIGMSGFYICSNKCLEEGIKLSKEYDLPIHLHFCENSKEVENIKSNYNVTDVVSPIKKYLKDCHLILAHSVKLTENDIKELSKLNVYIAHCPISNLKLGCGIAPIHNMIKNNIVVSLGTDGQGSGCNLDMFETMKFAALLQKGILEDPKVLPSYEILKMATINGAKSLKLDDRIGTIEEGKIADLIILNLNTIKTKPNNDVISQIVYNVNSSNVETTIVGGNVLMENKKLLIDVNENEIIKKCEKIIDRISK